MTHASKGQTVDLSKVKAEVERKLRKPHDRPEKASDGEWVHVGISGFDELMEKGIPKGSSVLLAGGPGTGKTIFGLQTAYFGAAHGEKVVYMSFEESEDRLRKHMQDFGWDAAKAEKEGNLIIKRYKISDITRSVEALLEKAKGELLIDVTPIIFPGGMKPDRVVIDSLTAIAAAFVGKDETYRIYIEQLFRLLEQQGSTSFLITESSQIPVRITESGVEEFLADGVVVLYNLKRGNVRERAIEILKMRGAQHQKKIVAMQVLSGKGVVVYPEQEVFAETG